jgi:predicted RNA-binding Zn ribbon-like protein
MSEITPSSFKFIAEHLGLDFANTVHWHASDHPLDTLPDYEALVRWSHEAGILDKARFKALMEKAVRSPDEAHAVHARAVVLREAIYRICVARIHAQVPPETDLATLNDELVRWRANVRIVLTSDRFIWDYNVDLSALDSPLWSIVQNTADLLTSENISRIGQCADDRGCGWLFLDASKNHSRRWCDINDCGNRAKQRRYQKRHGSK